jgi:hypothetical protein
MVVMEQDQKVSIRKVEIKQGEAEQGLKLHDFQKGVKLMDTYPLTDTGNVMTEDPNFAVVYLTQGAGEADKCTVSRKIVSGRDLNKIKIEGDDNESGNEDDYWLSESESD